MALQLYILSDCKKNVRKKMANACVLPLKHKEYDFDSYIYIICVRIYSLEKYLANCQCN